MREGEGEGTLPTLHTLIYIYKDLLHQHIIDGAAFSCACIYHSSILPTS